MGAFSVNIELRPLAGDEWRAFSLLVDTGSTYTWIPRAALNIMGVAPQYQREFETADGRVVRRDVAVLLARIDREELPTLVVFADDNDASLLGVVTLEEFSMGVDPVNHRPIPVRGLAMGR